MRKYLVKYEKAISHNLLCTWSLLNFLIYEKNFLFFFNSIVMRLTLLDLNWKWKEETSLCSFWCVESAFVGGILPPLGALLLPHILRVSPVQVQVLHQSSSNEFCTHQRWGRYKIIYCMRAVQYLKCRQSRRRCQGQCRSPEWAARCCAPHTPAPHLNRE